eukprot:jgi/Mesvir1/21627/Mv04049-RA.1
MAVNHAMCVARTRTGSACSRRAATGGRTCAQHRGAARAGRTHAMRALNVFDYDDIADLPDGFWEEDFSAPIIRPRTTAYYDDDDRDRGAGYLPIRRVGYTPMYAGCELLLARLREKRPKARRKRGHRTRAKEVTDEKERAKRAWDTISSDPNLFADEILNKLTVPDMLKFGVTNRGNDLLVKSNLVYETNRKIADHRRKVAEAGAAIKAEMERSGYVEKQNEFKALAKRARMNNPDVGDIPMEGRAKQLSDELKELAKPLDKLNNDREDNRDAVAGLKRFKAEHHLDYLLDRSRERAGARPFGTLPPGVDHSSASARCRRSRRW